MVGCRLKGREGGRGGGGEGEMGKGGCLGS
jgi:hypothetical protein